MSATTLPEIDTRAVLTDVRSRLTAGTLIPVLGPDLLTADGTEPPVPVSTRELPIGSMPRLPSRGGFGATCGQWPSTSKAAVIASPS